MTQILLDLPLPKDQPTQWIVVCLVILTILYVIVRPILKKKDPLKPSPRLGLSRQRDVEKQMESLLVELSNMARQISSQLDTRAARLESLINDADQRIAQLQALHGASLAPPTENGSRGEERSAAIRPAPIDSRHAQVYGLADQGRSPQEISRELGRPNGEIELILALRPRT